MSKRPKAGAGGAGVQLFPFLAVLLCTMGALILLLMLIAQQARATAEAEAEAARVAARAEAARSKVDNAELERKRDDLQWRIKQLAAAREKTLADVGTLREQLSHLEEHSARLRKQLDEMSAADKLLASRSTTTDEEKAKLEAELADLRAKIADAKLKLEQAKAAGRKAQAFAVVPYDGSNGTRRRPIYIECRGDAVVLQPEGTKFLPVDFAGSLGPSNPLASCVRLVSETITRDNRYAEGEQPYPLLLVRPSGIGAYYKAREAMQSWDSDFGYELIDEDWPLEFPPADPLLAQMLTKTADEARQRQVIMARAAPRLREQRGGAPTFNLTEGSGGGFDAGGNGGGEGSGAGRRFVPPNAGYSSTREPTPENTGDRYGNLAGAGNGGRYPGVAPGGNLTAQNNGGLGGATPGTLGGLSGGNGGPALGNPTQGSGALGGSGSNGGTPSTVGDRYAANSGGNGPYSPGGAGPNGAKGPHGPSDPNSLNPAGPFDTAAAGGGNGAGGPQGSGQQGTGQQQNPGQAGGAQPGYGTVAGTGSSGYGTAPNGQNGTNTGGTATSGVANAGGGASAGGAPSFLGGSPSSGASGGSAGGSSGASASGDPSASPPSLSVNVPPGPGEYVESMAQKRGKNWGLPESSPRSTPLTRPIQLYVSRDQLTLFSDRGLPDKQIVFSGKTEDAVDTLVAQIWDHVKTWGLAGRGMYWKPVLSVHVAPDGAARFNELKQLLANSGLELNGKQIQLATPAQPTQR